jgi:SAM-dependent methyltransferase
MNSVFTDPRLKKHPMGSSAWFQAQHSLIFSKPLIKRCYDLWYSKLLADADSVPSASPRALMIEVGSGSGYIKTLRPGVITSDITPGEVDLVLDGRLLPFATGSARAIFLTHVLHHIPDVESFFVEAERVLVPQGVVSMVEVTHTPFARLFFSKVHPEPYNDTAPEWSFPGGHTMLDSNQALSWMVFFRDRHRFERRFPNLQFERWEYLPWFSYLLSGGVNLRSFFPRPLATLIGAADPLLRPLDPLFAIHWHLTLRKRI